MFQTILNPTTKTKVIVETCLTVNKKGFTASLYELLNTLADSPFVLLTDGEFPYCMQLSWNQNHWRLEPQIKDALQSAGLIADQEIFRTTAKVRDQPSVICKDVVQLRHGSFQKNHLTSFVELLRWIHREKLFTVNGETMNDATLLWNGDFWLVNYEVCYENQ